MTPTLHKARLTGILIAGIALLLGTAIYLAARPDDIYLNRFLSFFLHPGIIDGMQSLYISIAFPQWLRYSLPDGIWMFAFVIIMLIIWDFRIDRKSIPWIAMVLLTGGGYETLQGFQWMSGTFDQMDLLFMFLGAMLPLSVIFIKYNLCKN